MIERCTYPFPIQRQTNPDPYRGSFLPPKMSMLQVPSAVNSFLWLCEHNYFPTAKRIRRQIITSVILIVCIVLRSSHSINVGFFFHLESSSRRKHHLKRHWYAASYIFHATQSKPELKKKRGLKRIKLFCHFPQQENLCVPQQFLKAVSR